MKLTYIKLHEFVDHFKTSDCGTVSTNDPGMGASVVLDYCSSLWCARYTVVRTDLD